MEPLSIESLLFFTDEIQEWGRPSFSDLYGGKIKNPNQKVYLNEYSADNIEWSVDANEISMPQAIFWLISVSQKFSQRFRPAPEEGDRTFCCSWMLTWQCKGVDFEGKFFFDKVDCNISILKVNKPYKLELKDYLNDFNSGRYKTTEEIVDHIINKNNEYKSNIEP